MAINPVRTLDDGSTVVRDDSDGYEAVLRPGQLADLRSRGSGRAVLDEIVRSNAATGDPRTEQERTMAENASQGQGEAHQENER